MICRICKGKASVELRAHNISLCSKDFIIFFERRILKTIEKFNLIKKNEDKTAVAVSGGKDSLSLLYVLKILGYEASGVYINLGIPDYSEISKEKCKIFSERFDIPVYMFSLTDYLRKNIYEVSRFMKRPACSVCGNVKRYVMNRFCIEYGYTTLATGHNLDDEAATLFSNLMNFNRNHLGKEFLSLPSKLNTVKKVKPFALVSEREVAIYALLNNIDYIYDECPYSKGATSLKYKEAINFIEEGSPGSKLKFMKNYLKNIDIFNSDAKKPKEDNSCSLCGFLTTQNVCSFCNILIRVGAENIISDFRDYFVKL